MAKSEFSWAKKIASSGSTPAAAAVGSSFGGSGYDSCRARKRTYDELAQELRRAVRRARILEGKAAEATEVIMELRRET